MRPPQSIAVAPDASLPVPSASELIVERATHLFGRGHLHEALALLDTIGVDPAYGKRGVGHTMVSQLFGNLEALRGNEHRVRYVLHARSFPVVVPYPVNSA